MKNVLPVWMLSVAFCAAAVNLSPNAAMAFTRTIPASACARRGNASSSHSVWIHGGEEYRNTSTTSGWDCPIADDTSLTHKNIQQVLVDVWDGSNTTELQAQACVRDYGSNTYYCGSTASSGTSANGFATLSPGVTAIQNVTYQAWYAWVAVYAGTSSSGHQLLGMFSTD
jgi:hypothetical protein